MRSRYTAYCEGAVHYLLETTTVERRASLLPGALRTYCAGLRGVSLEVLETEGGGPDDRTGTVTFRARLRLRGRPFEQVEKSLFEREGGRWVYVDALS
jgi:SEC-C motif-containing protein